MNAGCAADAAHLETDRVCNSNLGQSDVALSEMSPLRFSSPNTENRVKQP